MIALAFLFVAAPLLILMNLDGWLLNHEETIGTDGSSIEAVGFMCIFMDPGFHSKQSEVISRQFLERSGLLFQVGHLKSG